MSRALVTAAICALAAGCRPTLGPEQPRASLETGALEYAVSFENGMYRASIDYTYTNRSLSDVSATHCHTPPPPILEKRVGGRWVRAYNPIMLMCLTIPHFRIPAGETYRGVLPFAASVPGRNVMPVLEVDATPGTYRLRWRLRAGSDPEARDAPIVETISNEFRLVER